MRSIQITEYGGPEVLRLSEVPVPTPAEGEVLVRVLRAGLNFIDVYMRSGIYARSETYRSPLPMTIGMEGAGVIEAVGPNVSDWTSGDRVAYCLQRGSYANWAVVPAWKLVRIPEEIGFETAAALMLQGSTAHYLTHSAHRIEPGQKCLVHAGAGGVGQLLIQLAKARGATVIATVGSEEKARLASDRGADVCILYKTEDFRMRVMEITGGAGIDVVYDSVGRDTIRSSIRCLRRRGLCILFGASSGVVDSIEPIELAEAGSVFFTRPHLADYMASAEERRCRARDLFRGVSDGSLHVEIQQIFALDEVSDAHRMLEGRSSRGKLLLDLC